jgi:hypothetical protein
VRQRFRGCGAEGLGASCTGAEPADSALGLKLIGAANLRKGMENLKKVYEEGFEGNFFAKPAFMLTERADVVVLKNTGIGSQKVLKYIF